MMLDNDSSRPCDGPTKGQAHKRYPSVKDFRWMPERVLDRLRRTDVLMWHAGSSVEALRALTSSHYVSKRRLCARPLQQNKDERAACGGRTARVGSGVRRDMVSVSQP